MVQRAADDDVATFVAAALSELPRFLEFAADFFKPKNIDQTEVKAVFKHVRERLQTRYQPELPEADAVYPAIFGEKTTQNKDALSLIADNIFVNAVRTIKTPRTAKRIMIEPVVSLFMLSAVARAEANNKDSFPQLVAKFPDKIELTNAGRPLEWCAMWRLRMRLATAAGKQNFPLAKLLGVEGVEFNCTFKSQLDQLEEVTLNIPQRSRFVQSENFKGGKLPNSRQNAVAFLDALQGIPQNPRNLSLLQLADGEPWGIFFAAFDTFTRKCQVVYCFLGIESNRKSEVA